MRTELAKTTTAPILHYGDRDTLRELADRLRRFLPNGSRMSADEALAFAQTAVALDLDPFAHEVWFVERIGIMTGIAGYRKLARRQGHFTTRFRRMTAAERDEHQLADDDLGSICELYRPDRLREAAAVNRAAGEVLIPLGPTIGVGIWRAKELETKSGKLKSAPTGRSWQWITEKRAEADAIRRAFDLTIAFTDNGDATVIEGEIIEEIDEALPAWAEKALEEKPAINPEELARKRAMLRGDDEDWDAPENVAGRLNQIAAKVGELERDEALPADRPRDRQRLMKSSSDEAIERDFPPEEVENAPDVEKPQPIELPVEWFAYAQLACEKLGYTDYDAVADALRKYAGVERVADHRTIIQFHPVDAWIVLKDNAPAQQARML